MALIGGTASGGHDLLNRECIISSNYLCVWVCMSFCICCLSTIKILCGLQKMALLRSGALLPSGALLLSHYCFKGRHLCVTILEGVAKVMLLAHLPLLLYQLWMYCATQQIQ